MYAIRSYYAIHCRVDEAHQLLQPLMVFGGQGLQYFAFEVAGAAYHVLAGDNVQRAGIAVFKAQTQAFGQGAGDLVQYLGADRGGDHVRLADLFEYIAAGGIDRADVTDGVDLVLGTDHIDLVFSYNFV